MERCTKCILPITYPGITFDISGVCNHCLAYKEKNYLGDRALKTKITSYLKNRNDRNFKYDCILGFSGGRDSSYLLYYLVKILNLKVIAYSLDNGFVPQQTKLNIKSMADQLSVPIIIEKSKILKKCFRHHMLSFIHKPSPAMIGMLCVGCRVAIDLGIYFTAKKYNVPIIIAGATPFEGTGYKENILKLKSNSKGKFSFVAGYLNQIAKNPRWILNPICSITQIKEYYYHYLRNARKTEEILYIAPFHSYKRWQEREIVSTIENEFGWKKHPDLESSWRGDCEVALIKSFLYKKYLGYNDKDDNLSCLIRDKQVNRKKALRKIEKNKEVSGKIIEEILNKHKIPFSHLKRLWITNPPPKRYSG